LADISGELTDKMWKVTDIREGVTDILVKTTDKMVILTDISRAGRKNAEMVGLSLKTAI